MTKIELTMQLSGRVDYISRHRPLLMHIQVFLFGVGFMFYVSGITIDVAYTVETWGNLLYKQPTWFWGAFNAIAAAVLTIGLVSPPNTKMIMAGSFLQILHFSAIALSCIFYGGDFAIGLWGVGFLAFHAKIFYEAVRLS